MAYSNTPLWKTVKSTALYWVTWEPQMLLVLRTTYSSNCIYEEIHSQVPRPLVLYLVRMARHCHIGSRLGKPGKARGRHKRSLLTRRSGSDPMTECNENLSPAAPLWSCSLGDRRQVRGWVKIAPQPSAGLWRKGIRHGSCLFSWQRTCTGQLRGQDRIPDARGWMLRLLPG